ncbi:hypothetical protein QMZ05_20505 [Bradyrhizobium sp. INPA03-11B]|uniref:hypothetical protein n=1 Tax=Bradyrhizobium sp. INPA03-11B TaxID=418598 RepID=UPI00338F2DE4
MAPDFYLARKPLRRTKIPTYMNCSSVLSGQFVVQLVHRSVGPEGDAEEIQRRTHAAHGHKTIGLAAALAPRSSIVLPCEREPSNIALARRPGVGAHTIDKWRNRFIANRVGVFYGEIRTGKPRTVEAAAELITKTLAPKADLLERARHRQRDWTLPKSPLIAYSNFSVCSLVVRAASSSRPIPFFFEKLREVVGLDLNPPDKGVALCVPTSGAGTTPAHASYGVRLHRRCYPDYRRHGISCLPTSTCLMAQS